MDTAPKTLSQLRADLPGFAFNDYLRHLPAAEAAGGAHPPLRVAVLRSYTIEPIEPVLRLRLLVEGFKPTMWFGGFNQYTQEIVDSASGLHEFRPDLVLLMVRLEELAPDFVDEFASRPAAEWSERLRAKVHELGALVARLEQTTRAQVIVQNASLVRGYFGVYDPQRPEGQDYLVHEFNRALAAQLADRKSAFVWDFERLVRERGHEQLHDAKSWYVSRNPYRQSAYPAIADDLMRYVRSAFGRVKKCVVLDLDNTLWGGVAGEDGMEGIALGHTYPGNCYRDFQRELLKLYHRGILLAINSKNNEQDALQIIDQHPDMVLRRQHFAAMRINWSDKATNLRELAKELNIGVDSLIMIDDNPAECELIRRECPECDVVLLPDKPYSLPAIPRGLPGVDNIRLTDEDRQKGEMYRARAARAELENSFTDLGEFLASLGIEARLESAVPFSIPRIAQLTQKTNQLNMTTRRYTEAQIQAFVDDPSYEVYSVSSRDRFGDDGIIGVFILKVENEESRIDTFLLSCRVIGRGIEQLMVAFIAELSRERGARTLTAEFIPTAKNKPAAGIYEKLGFAKRSDTLFVSDLRVDTFSRPAHIHVASGNVEPRAAAR